MPTLTGSLDDVPDGPPSECLEEAVGECGPLKGTCMPGGAPCCSAGGFCGTGEAYCGSTGFGGGMQPEYSNGKNLCGGHAAESGRESGRGGGGGHAFGADDGGRLGLRCGRPLELP